jgi:hypothetical protein
MSDPFNSSGKDTFVPLIHYHSPSVVLPDIFGIMGIEQRPVIGVASFRQIVLEYDRAAMAVQLLCATGQPVWRSL